jgi:hypothetical protein
MNNFYAVNPAEFFVAEELQKRRPDLQVFFPLKDVGADLLLVDPKKDRRIYIQVKESRFYSGSSWHQLKAGKEKEDADVFVFVTYVPTAQGARLAFQKDYMVIPRERLIQLCANKKLMRDRYSFYFAPDKGKVYEERDNRIDVTEFHNAWHLI